MPREAPVTMATLVPFSVIGCLLLAKASDRVSARPGRAEDDRAEIFSLIVGILQRQHVGLHVAERRLRLLDDTLSEVIDNAFLEVRLARVARTNFVPVFV